MKDLFLGIKDKIDTENLTKKELENWELHLKHRDFYKNLLKNKLRKAKEGKIFLSTHDIKELEKELKKYEFDYENLKLVISDMRRILQKNGQNTKQNLIMTLCKKKTEIDYQMLRTIQSFVLFSPKTELFSLRGTPQEIKENTVLII